MNKLFIPALSILGLFASGAYAHTHVEKAVPADNSTVKAAPKEIMLHFNEAARLTALSIQKEGEKEQAVKPLPSAPSEMVSVPIPPLAPGKYLVTYRVMGDDNHVMSGKLHFTVSGP